MRSNARRKEGLSCRFDTGKRERQIIDKLFPSIRARSCRLRGDCVVIRASVSVFDIGFAAGRIVDVQAIEIIE